MPNISVIIPVYNEEKVVGRCLESLLGQTAGAREIIVVDDGSTDKTGEIVSGIKDINNINVIKIQQNHRGAGAARNLGVKGAVGDILVFVDADMRFSRTFLEDLTQPVREGKSKGTFSKLELISNWDNIWARLWNYQKGIYEPRAVPEDYPDTAPVFRAILKSEFEKAGGFDETRGYDDDWSLSERLGYRATATKARYYHDNPASLREVFWQARWAAKRKYKLGILGVLGSLGRGLARRCPAEEWLWYLVFWGVYAAGTVIGVAEFYLTNKGYK